MNMTQNQIERELDDVREQIHDILGKSKALDQLITKEREQRFPSFDQITDEQTRDETTCMCWLLVMSRFLDSIA